MNRSSLFLPRLSALAARSGTAWLLAVALLLAQTLALLHGAVHPTGRGGASAPEVWQVSAAQPASATDSLWADHDADASGSACRLVDQVGQLGMAAPVLPAWQQACPEAGAAPAPQGPAWRSARSWAQQARAPPRA